MYSSLFWHKGPASDFKGTIYFSLGELLPYNVVLTSAPQQCTYLHSLSGLAPTSTSHPSRSSQNAQLSLCPTAFPPAAVQLLCRARVFAAPWTTACEALLSSTISRSLLKFVSIELVMLANHRILCHPLLLLPSVFPSFPLASCFTHNSILSEKLMDSMIEKYSESVLLRIHDRE